MMWLVPPVALRGREMGDPWGIAWQPASATALPEMAGVSLS